MVGCILFKLCHCKCAKAYLLEILVLSRLWHDLMAHGHMCTNVPCKDSFERGLVFSIYIHILYISYGGGGHPKQIIGPQTLQLLVFYYIYTVSLYSKNCTWMLSLSLYNVLYPPVAFQKNGQN